MINGKYSLFLLAVATTTTVAAQSPSTSPMTQPNTNSWSVTTGLLQIDNKAYGNFMFLSAALARQFTRYTLIEANTSIAKVTEDWVNRSTSAVDRRHRALTTVGLTGQLQLPVGRLAPYVGGGGGLWHESAVTSPAVWVAAGMRVAISSTRCLRAELRIRDDTLSPTAESPNGAEWHFGFQQRF